MYKDKIHQFSNLKERANFLELVSSNANYFGTLPKSKLPTVLALKGDTYYEEITDVGYHPDLKLMTATIQVKQPVGYLGGTCSEGSVEYVRFYLDYGAGWEDQGYTGIKVFDIPESIDCQGQVELPLNYVANLNLIPKANLCNTPVLPKLRAVLSWNSVPPHNSPDFPSVWGNSYDNYIQIKPQLGIVVVDPIKKPALVSILYKVLAKPEIPLSQFLASDQQALEEVADFVKSQQPAELSVGELANIYNKEKKAVGAGRFGLTTIKAIQGLTDIQQAQVKINNLVAVGFQWENALKELEETSADTAYEQLMTVGLGIKQNTFEATFQIKQRLGYSGNLCTTGSKEYVSFWADFNNDCHWTFVGTGSVAVHDIPDIPPTGLSYTVVVPYDFSWIARSCNAPKVVKIRAVLSWNIPPSSIDPDALNFWGNLIDSYILIPIRPSINSGLFFNILGGISIDKIDPIIGLTLNNAKFAADQSAVEAGAPFAEEILIQGQLAAGTKYRFLVTNLNTNASQYINNSFIVDGLSGNFPFVNHTPVPLNLNNHYYTALSSELNTDNILARWTPGTDDLWRIDMEDITGAVVFSRNIQLHNSAPIAFLTVNDGGDCRHFHKGDAITGTFTVLDDDVHNPAVSYVSSYGLGSTIGSFTVPYAAPSINGYSDVISRPFSIDSSNSPTLCGKVYLNMHSKTVLNSKVLGVYRGDERIICLQP